MTTAFAPAPVAAPKAQLYRILVGVHIGDGPEGCTCVSCRIPKGQLGHGNHRYEAWQTYSGLARKAGQEPLPRGTYRNDLILSTVDLVALHNFPHSRKFERVAVEAPPAPPAPAELPVVTGKDLASMEARELRQLAKLLGVQVADGASRDELFQALTGRPRN